MPENGGFSAAEIEREKRLALGYSGESRPARLWHSLPKLPQKNVLRCDLCAHYCVIKDGDVGACLIRKNEGGKLYSLNWGKAEGLAVDPMEKKPFFHFKPGTRVLSFGAPGCNFRCLNCQNWQLSQAVKQLGPRALQTPLLTPEMIAASAVKHQVDGVAYTYSEPTIFFEYAYDTIQACRKKMQKEKKEKNKPGLPPDFFHVFVSNGYFTKEMLDLVVRERLLSAIRIDLKFMDDKKYWRICGGRVQNVLDSIKRVAALRQNADWPVHLEVINLVIPGENDSDDDFEAVSSFIRSISPDIPLHFSRFFPLYKMADKTPTSTERLLQARKIAQDAGLHYAYVGNTDLPGAEDTHCPKCNHLLIQRDRFGIEKNVFEGKKKTEGKKKSASPPACPACGEKINLIL
ncbi:Radical SAM superfamily protein [uncultured archaeon]|nr:Radical SAM superfamily protein [uncultured archaeon]